MRFDFYTIEQAEKGGAAFRPLNAVSLEAAPASAIETVNARFAELVGSNPDIGSMIVVCRPLGGPAGTVVAAERVSAQTRETRERRGRPNRELVWVVDESEWAG